MRLLSLGLSKLLFLAAIVCLPATAATAATKHVNAGNIFFTDVSSSTTNPAITTINVGDTVQWDWVNGTHSTVSGSCSGGSCSPDGMWNGPVTQENPSFSLTFNSPGTYTYYCFPHLAAMQGTVVVVQPADFTVAVFDSDGGTVGGPIFPGQQTVFDGTVAASNGFNNAVFLSCQPGATVSPSSCTPSPVNAIPNFTFTITAGAATPGHYSFAAQGTDGISLTHSFANLNFDVVDFGIAAPLPSSLTAFYEPSTSASTSSSVTLSAIGNLPDSVSLACESNTLPPGATCNFLPVGPSYSPTASVPVNVSASITVPAATTAGNYNVVLDVTSDTDAGSVTKTQGLPLHVVQFTPSAFAPTAVTVGAGNISDSATTQLTASPNFLIPGTVTLACTAGLPAGGACNFSNNGVASSFPSSESVAVSVPFNTPAAAPTVTVTATGNSGGASFAQNQPLTLHIPAPALSLGTPSPTNVAIVDHSFSAPVTVQITPTNLAGIVSLSCGNLPAGVTCRFSPSAAVNVAGRPTSFVVVFEANGAPQGDVNNITIQANATINSTSVSSSVGLGQLSIAVPGSTTNVSLSATAVNTLTNTTLINVGDPNLKITASVNNSTSTIYTAAIWEVTFSNPVNLVTASNPNCSQVVPTVVSCNIGDVASGVHLYSFKVAPMFGRTLVIDNVVTSPSVGDSDLTDNTATALAVQIRPRPFARKGLVPKTP